jgi:single-strand DNA-binding protein
VNETFATLVGNVATEVRTTTSQTGVPISSFRIASTTRRYERAKGGWADLDTLYVTVVCWRSLAENVAASLAKGDPVLVHGRLRMRQWAGDEGRSGTAVELEASTVGPDLSRGLTTFTRVRPREVERPGRSEADELAEQVGREAMATEGAQAAAPAAGSGPGDTGAHPDSATAARAGEAAA